MARYELGRIVTSGLADPGAAPPTPAGPSRPALAADLRRDVYVENLSAGLVVTSGCVRARGLASGTRAWAKGLRAGDLIPLSLEVRSSFVMRVVVGGELDPQEAGEWVGRLDWKLKVPDGQLAVCGGVSHVRHLEIPPGHYRAALYMYVQSVNGPVCLEDASGCDESYALGEWFRRTRPGQKFPAWLHNRCVHDPSEDPGHETEWEKSRPLEPVDPCVDFLLHLTPVEPGECECISLPALEGGWFSMSSGCRVLERAPLGLAAFDPHSARATSFRPRATRVPPPTPGPRSPGPSGLRTRRESESANGNKVTSLPGGSEYSRRSGSGRDRGAR